MKKTILFVLCILLTLGVAFAETHTYGDFSVDIPDSFRDVSHTYEKDRYIFDGFPSTGNLEIYILEPRPTLSLATAEAEKAIRVSLQQKPEMNTKEINGYPFIEIVYKPRTHGKYCSIAVFASVNGVYALRLDGAYYRTDDFQEKWDGLLNSIVINDQVLDDEIPDFFTQYTTLKKGSSGEAVQTLQERLIELGYLEDKADGVFGGKTKVAVELFQKAIGVTSNGVADELTQGMLFSENAPVRKIEMSSITETVGDYATTVWTVEGQSFVLSGKQTKKIVIMGKTYVFYSDGSYDVE